MVPPKQAVESLLLIAASSALLYFMFYSIKTLQPTKVIPSQTQPVVAEKDEEENGEAAVPTKATSANTNAPMLKKKESLEPPTKAELSQKESALGTKAFKSASYQTSIDHFSRAIELCPDVQSKKVMYYNRAAAHQKLGEFAESVADTTLALRIDPLYKHALARRILANEALNEGFLALVDSTLLRQLQQASGSADEEAAATSVEKWSKALGEEEAKRLWPQLKSERHRPHELVLPIQINSVKQYYYSFSSQVQEFQSPPSQLEIDSFDVQNMDLFSLAMMHKYRMDFRSCFDILLKLQGKGSKSAQAKCQLELSGLYHVCNDLLSSKSCTEAAQSLEETCLGFIQLALLAVEDGDFSLAKQHLAKCKPLTPCERADVLFHQASIACIEFSDLHMVKDLMLRGLAECADFGLAHMQLGIVHFRLGETEEALQSLSQACALVPELAEVHNFHGEVLMSLQQSEQALVKFMDAQQADSRCALPLLNRGALLLQREQPTPDELAQALAFFNQAVESDPESDIAFVHRASYFCLMEDFEQGLDNYRQAIRLARAYTDLQEYCCFQVAAKAQREVQKQFTQQ